jgi:RNA polymerase sigma factor (sigma-70 family)
VGVLRKGLDSADLDALLEAAKADANDGSPQMNEIVRRFQALAWKLARGRTKSADLRWDLANAALIELVRAVRAHNGKGAFPAYAKMRLRYEVNREHERWFPVIELNEVPDTGPRLRKPAAIDASIDPIFGALFGRPATWNGREVADVLGGLSADRRNLVLQCYVDGMNVTEIAAAEGISKSAVSQRLSTIHRQLAELLAA